MSKKKPQKEDLEKEIKKYKNMLEGKIEVIDDDEKEKKKISKKEKTEKIEIIDDNSSNSIVKIIFLTIAFISLITYIVIQIMHVENMKSFIPNLLGIITIFLFLICFIVMAVKSEKKTLIVIFGSLIITAYSLINIFSLTGLIKLPNDEIVPNFYNQTLTEINDWKEKNNIMVNESYEYSDNIAKYHIISQDVNYPSLTKDIKKMNITISLGPDLAKEIIVPNFVGKNINDVLKYIDENYLSNVEIKYEVSPNTIDTIISQEGSGTLRRNSLITLTVAKASEFGDIEIIDFTNKTKLYATSWLAKYDFKVKIEEEFSDDINEGYVIKQSITNQVANPETDEITLTISKGKMMVAPDILSMNVNDINDWVMDNNLKVVYKEQYSDEVKLGDVIDTSIKKDDILENGQEIEVTISKGTLAMIGFDNINEFTNWATTNNIPFDINYEYSNNYKKDEIIKCSHQKGAVIKKDDTVIVTVSKGKSINLPNFVGMNKESIKNKCSEINLNCSFKTGNLTEKTPKDIAIAQSKRVQTEVSEGTSLVITLSGGIIKKVTIPSFVGKAKNDIQSTCKSLGITCNFNYQQGYSDKAKDICVSQNKSGSVNQGSSITITLSKGPAKTYNVIIDANQLSSGNPTATKNTLEAKLKKACPGVNFNFKLVKANSGIGYLAPTSQVKIGSNNLTQGKTYTVIINSN